jgi:hypothetical protein
MMNIKLNCILASLVVNLAFQFLWVGLAMTTPATDSSPTTIASQAAQANAINWNTVILALFSLLTTIVTTFGGIYLYKIKGATDETRAAAWRTADNVDKIHTAVNSERTAMLKHVEDLKEEILNISKTNAVLMERLSRPG